MSYNNWCNTVGPAVAENLVSLAHDKFMNRGDQTYQIAINNLNAMDNIPLDGVSFNVDFNFDGQLAAFNRPQRPVINAADFDFRPVGGVGTAPTYLFTPPAFDPAPVSTAVAPSLAFGARPQPPVVAIPIAPPPPGALVMPIEPGYVLPDVPTFEQLNLPSKPSLVLPTFNALAPVFVEPPFNETWDFNPQEYVPFLKNELVAAITPMLQAKPALPEAIEAMIFQKGRSRIEVERDRNIDAAVAEWGGRGFSEPPGMLNGTILELTQGAANQVAEYSREAAIKQYEETLQNLRFAITNGAALEGVYVGLHIEEQRFLLQAAQFQRDSALARLNAYVSVVNARTTIYQAEAGVFETRIRATLATIEIYKAEIEGELAKGQINEQRVKLYEGMLRGVGVLADFYRNRLEAVKIQSEAEKNVVDRYKAEVDAYDARFRAFASETQGYIAGVEGQGKVADVYRTLVDAEGKRIDQWSTASNLKLEAKKLEVIQHGQTLDVWKAGVTRFGSELEAERARLAAVGQRAEALAAIYRADADVEQASSASTDRSFELGLRKATTDADFQLKTAELYNTQHKGLIDSLIEIARAKMQVASQLAASSMSAVGYSAQVSSSNNQAKSCQSNFSFSGEIADA